MPIIACVGDSTTHGGNVLTGSATIRIDGRYVAREGDLVSCPQHGTHRILAGSPVMKDDHGKPVALDGHRTACGSLLIAQGNGAVVR